MVGQWRCVTVCGCDAGNSVISTLLKKKKKIKTAPPSIMSNRSDVRLMILVVTLQQLTYPLLYYNHGQMAHRLGVSDASSFLPSFLPVVCPFNGNSLLEIVHFLNAQTPLSETWSVVYHSSRFYSCIKTTACSCQDRRAFSPCIFC